MTSSTRVRTETFVMLANTKSRNLNPIQIPTVTDPDYESHLYRYLMGTT